MANESRVDSWPVISPVVGGELIAAQDDLGAFGSLTPNAIADLAVQRLVAAFPYAYIRLSSQFQTNVEADNNNNPTNWVDVLTLTMPDSETINGDYSIELGFSWTSTVNNRAAYWRAVVNGVPTPFVRITSRDNQDLNPEFFRLLNDFDGNGDLEVTLQCVLENGGGSSTVTIEPNALGISIDAKKNFDL